MQLQIITLFPQYFESPLKTSLLGKALSKGVLEVSFADLKDYAKDGRADDTPFGGGPGMVIQYDPLKKALQSFKNPGKTLCLSPSGALWNDKKARAAAQMKEPLTLVCGRYEGLDERFIQRFVHEEISLGDYVLCGGEAGALVLIESLFRFLPEAVGNKQSVEEDSFGKSGLLSCPVWTKPRVVDGQSAPEFLFTGHHQKIKTLRSAAALVKTWIQRPDLLSPDMLSLLPQALKDLSALSDKDFSCLRLPPLRRLKELQKTYTDLV